MTWKQENKHKSTNWRSWLWPGEDICHLHERAVTTWKKDGIRSFSSLIEHCDFLANGVTNKPTFTARASVCLYQHWHKDQAPDNKFHNWFHFYVDRVFHCRQFHFIPIMVETNRYFIRYLQVGKLCTMLFEFSISLICFTLEHFSFSVSFSVSSIGCLGFNQFHAAFFYRCQCFFYISIK